MDRRFRQYLLVSFVLSWTVAFVFRFFGGSWNTTSAVPVGVLFMFMPLVAALALQVLADREPVRALGISFRPNRWFLAAWLVPPVLAGVGIGIELLMPGVSWSPGMEGMFARFEEQLTPDQTEQLRRQIEALPFNPFWLGLAEGLIAGITVNAAVAFGEELGWRGYLFKVLAPLGFWRMSLVTGLVWGIWHAPLIAMGHNYPEHPYAGVAIMVGWTVLVSPLFTYIRIRSGSVIAASILHGTINGTFGLALLPVAGGSDLTIGMTGLAGLIVLPLANGAMVLYDLRFRTDSITGKNSDVRSQESGTKVS
jgi:membrane protease YdiL (CAAX protease family)